MSRILLFLLCLSNVYLGAMQKNTEIEINYYDKKFSINDNTEDYKKYWQSEIINDFLDQNSKNYIASFPDIYLASILQQTPELKKCHEFAFKICIDHISNGLIKLANLIDNGSFLPQHRKYFSTTMENLYKQVSADTNLPILLDFLLLKAYDISEISGSLSELNKKINENNADDDKEQKLIKLQKAFEVISDFDNPFEDQMEEKVLENIRKIEGVYGEIIKINSLINADNLEEDKQNLNNLFSNFTKIKRKEIGDNIKKSVNQWRNNIVNHEYNVLFINNLSVFHISNSGELMFLSNNPKNKKKTIDEIHITIGYENNQQTGGNKKYSIDIIKAVNNNTQVKNNKDLLKQLQGEFEQFLQKVTFEKFSLYGNWLVAEGITQPHNMFANPHVSWTEMEDNIARIIAFGLINQIEVPPLQDVLDKIIRVEFIKINLPAVLINTKITLKQLFIRTKFKDVNRKENPEGDLSLYLAW